MLIHSFVVFSSMSFASTPFIPLDFTQHTYFYVQLNQQPYFLLDNWITSDYSKYHIASSALYNIKHNPCHSLQGSCTAQWAQHSFLVSSCSFRAISSEVKSDLPPINGCLPQYSDSSKQWLISDSVPNSIVQQYLKLFSATSYPGYEKDMLEMLLFG